MSSGPIVGILYQRTALAAKRLSDLDRDTASQFLCDEHLPLSEALEREWDEDAHFIIYSLHDGEDNAVFARATKRSPFVADLLRDGGSVKVNMLVFDHDLPKTVSGDRQEKQVWTEEGLTKFLTELGESNLPDPTYFYTTLHGSRFVYVLDKPVSHTEAEGLAKVFIDEFEKSGIKLDPQCTDWTRLFRLPKTIRADTHSRFSDEANFIFVNTGPVLDTNGIDVGRQAGPETYADVPPYEGEIPTPEQVAFDLQRQGGNGKTVDSPFVKVAKKYLIGREAYSVCFDHRPLDTKDGRNNAIVKTAGQIIGMTARQEEATPEGVYALLFSSLEQLNVDDTEQGNDWHAIAWDIIKRMWSNEQAQIEAELREIEQKVIAGKNLRQGLLDQIKKERPGDVPKDDDQAELWFRQRMIASNGKQHYIMRPDGAYNIQAVSDSMVIPMIRELKMEEVIEIYEMQGRNNRVIRSTQKVLNDAATPITTILCSSAIRTAFIDGPSGHRVLNMPVHRLNPKVSAKYSFEVQEWLEVLFGDKIDLGMEWLSWCLEVSSPICALNLWGPSGTGKGMLAQGIAECFESERLNNGMTLGKYNAGLLESPLVNCDEGVPNIKSDESLSIDQAFRTMVTGGSVTIRSMYMNAFNARIYPRILFTSNDPDIIKGLVGHRDLTDSDIRALEIRLLSIEVQSKAIMYLTAKGNYAYTSGWIHGKTPSRYVLAGHIMALYKDRKPSKFGTGRLLVEGEVGTSLVRGLRLKSGGAQAVVKALLKLIEGNQPDRSGIHVTKDGRVMVTATGVVDYIMGAMSGIDEKVSLPRCWTILRQFSLSELDNEDKPKKTTPEGAPRGRWIEVDLGILFEEAVRYGSPCQRLEALLRMQEDGPYKIAAAIAHSGQDD